MCDEARHLHNQVDRDVKWEWSERGLAASDAVSSHFPLCRRTTERGRGRGLTVRGGGGRSCISWGYCMIRK